MHWIRQDKENCLISIQVVPRASKNEIQGVLGDALKVRLTAPPVDGKANAALIKFLSRELGISRAQIDIRRGQTGRNKIVRITGIRVEAVQLKMQELLE